MGTRVLDQLGDWESEPFSGGYARLRDLADRGFSGVVRSGPATLCFLNGAVVGVLDGSIDRFEDGGGTVYQAPSPALSLLALMQERSDEVRAKYYTEDTPISEVDSTLTDGGFSGYVELSENVLSGDYYLVYHAGRSMAVAYIGNSGQLLTDDEAFDRTDGEVGIYEVRPVDVDPVEIPDPAGSTGTGRGDHTADASRTGEPATAAGAGDTTGEQTDGTEEWSALGTDDQSAGASAEDPAETGMAGNAGTAGESDHTSNGESRTSGERPRASGRGHQPSGSDTSNGATPEERTGSPGDDDTAGGDGPSPGRLETRTVPSLDPERTSDSSDDTGDGTPGTSAGTGTESGVSMDPDTESRRPERDTSGSGTSDRTEPATDRNGDRSDAGDRRGSGPEESDGPQAALEETEAELERARADLSEVEAERDQLRDRAAALAEERDSLVEERDRLATERDRLEAEIDRLESQLRQLGAEHGGATGADRRMQPAAALDETDLFVRYRSKSDPTLEAAHDGGTRAGDVESNLDLEYHTQFEAGNVSVDGRPFEEFLFERIQYRFVTWAVYNLLFEIRDAGRVGALQELYDAIPRIDRAELNGTVTAEYVEDGGERRTEEAFDVVLRDRMGNPLVVANVNDSREAATGELMNSLVDSASRVSESTDTLASAFLVTASFFEPQRCRRLADGVGYYRTAN